MEQHIEKHKLKVRQRPLPSIDGKSREEMSRRYKLLVRLRTLQEIMQNGPFCIISCKVLNGLCTEKKNEVNHLTNVTATLKAMTKKLCLRGSLVVNVPNKFMHHSTQN